MITDDDRERISGWFAGRLPSSWQPAEVTVDREEIVVVLAPGDLETNVPAGASEATRTEAAAGRAAGFREETRDQRMAIAAEAQRRFDRKVSWGVALGERRELWTHVAAPVMTRLRQPQRLTLDTLVESGVARSRADALAWCVRLVGQHEEEWLSDLRNAMTAVADVRANGPTA